MLYPAYCLWELVLDEKGQSRPSSYHALYKAVFFPSVKIKWHLGFSLGLPIFPQNSGLSNETRGKYLHDDIPLHVIMVSHGSVQTFFFFLAFSRLIHKEDYDHCLLQPCHCCCTHQPQPPACPNRLLSSRLSIFSIDSNIWYIEGTWGVHSLGFAWLQLGILLLAPAGTGFHRCTISSWR